MSLQGWKLLCRIERWLFWESIDLANFIVLKGIQFSDILSVQQLTLTDYNITHLNLIPALYIARTD